MRFDLNAALTAFRYIAHYDSFTRAAAELNVSASALSQTLRHLENHLGVRLFNRTTRQVRLTETGQVFLQRITPALTEIDAAIDLLRQNRDRPIGTLRITVPRVASQLILQPILVDFMQAYPEIHLDIDMSDSLRDLVAEGFDAGIRLGESVQRDMVAVSMGGAMRSVIVGSPSYFAIHGRPEHPHDLHKYTCFSYRFASSGAIYRWEFAEPAQLDKTGAITMPRHCFDLNMKSQLIVNDNGLLIYLACRGMGLCYAFESEVYHLLTSGQLESVLDDWQQPYDGFYLYYPHRTHLPPKLRVFIDFIRDKLK